MNDLSVADTNNGGLLAAMLAVQAETPTLRKDAVNPHFRAKYTPLDTIVETVGPILVKHGLVWTTLPGSNERGEPVLHYELIHAATGEAKTGTMPLLLTKVDPQGMGSAITYARRYSMCAVLNLVADVDDDGNRASGQVAGGAQRVQAARAFPPVSRSRAEGLVNSVWLVGVQDKLQLALAHIKGDDVGDCSDRAKATVAVSSLTVAEGLRLESWVAKKADEQATAEGDESW